MLFQLGVDTNPLKKAEGDVRQFSEKTASYLTMATMAAKAFVVTLAAVSIGKFMREALDNATEYQSALIDMGRVTQMSFNKIDERIRGMNANLGNATQLMRGYYQVLSAGVTNPLHAQNLLTDAAKLGKLAHIDQAETVKALTKFMQGYGDQLKDTAEAADVLITIDRLGQTSVAELIPVIGQLSNMAHTTGLTINEMSGSLALITQTAGSTRQAVTQLEMVMKAVTKPAKVLSDAFATLGYTSHGFLKEKGFLEWLKQVQQFATKDITITNLVGGRLEGFMGYSALQANNFDDLIEKIKEMDNRAGAFSRSWEQYLSGMAATLDTFKNKMYNLYLDIGSKWIPALTSGLKSVNEHFEAIVRTITFLLEFWVSKKIGTLLAGGLGAKMGSFAKGALMGAGSIIFPGWGTKEIENLRAASMAWDATTGTLVKVAEKTNEVSYALKGANIVVKGFSITGTLLGTALSRLASGMMGPGGIAAVFISFLELNKSLNREMEKLADQGEAMDKTIFGGLISKDLSSGLSFTGAGGMVEKIRKDLNLAPEISDKLDLIRVGYAETLAKLNDRPAVTGADWLAEKAKILQGIISGYREEIEKLTPVTRQMAMVELDKWFKAQADAIGEVIPELQQLYDLQKKAIMGPTPREGFSETMVSLFNTFKDMAGFASGAIKNLGMDKGSVATMFTETMLSAAEDAADSLVDKFDNPFMKQAFAQALEGLGKAGGNAFLVQLGKTLGGAKSKLDIYKEQLEAFKTEMEKYDEARKAMTEKVTAGQAYLTGIWGQKETYAVQAGMRFGESPTPGTYEAAFNAPVYEYQTLTRPTEPVKPTDTLENAAENFVKALPEGLKKLDLNAMLQPLKDALGGLVPAGEEAGSATGTALGNGMEIGALSAIERIKRAIASIPTTIDLSLSPDSVKGLSKQLAKELAAAGRE
jgi:TP901 family phage tail tape measure protein